MISELAEQAQFYASLLGLFAVTVGACMLGVYLARNWPRGWRA